MNRPGIRLGDHCVAAPLVAMKSGVMGRTSDKRSKHELKRLVEQAVNTVCAPREGLWFCVDEVETHGNPPDRLRVWATLHFLAAGSPFCCGEPGCHLWLFEERLTQVADHVRRAMNLTQPLEIDFGDRIAARYHDGVEFEIDRQVRRAERSDE